MTRLVLTGAESSAKSTLTKFLGRALNLPIAPEYARLYLEQNGPHYDYASVHQIARQHLAYQTQCVPPNTPLAIFDTDLLNLKIWCEVAYGQVEPWLLDAASAEADHRYLLCRPDIPWQPDPLREFPDIERREWLFAKHLAAIQATGRDYEIVDGFGAERKTNALAAAQQLIFRSTKSA